MLQARAFIKMESSSEDNDDFDDLPSPTVLTVQTMLNTFETVNVLAPLVRCSKLPFRHLCSLYETHITHTPMILAEEFSRSQAARVCDFTTSREERGLFWMQPRGLNDRKDPKGVSSYSHPEDREFITCHKQGSSSRLPPSARPPSRENQIVKRGLLAHFA